MHCVSRGAHTRKAATLWPHPALPLPPQLAAAPADLPHLQDVCTRRSGPRGTRPPISCLPIAAPLVPAQAVGLPQCSFILLTRAATATATAQQQQQPQQAQQFNWPPQVQELWDRQVQMAQMAEADAARHGGGEHAHVHQPETHQAPQEPPAVLLSHPRLSSSHIRAPLTHFVAHSASAVYELRR